MIDAAIVVCMAGVVNFTCAWLQDTFERNDWRFNVALAVTLGPLLWTITRALTPSLATAERLWLYALGALGWAFTEAAVGFAIDVWRELRS